MPALLCERLLGALELNLPSLGPDRPATDLTGTAGLVAPLTRGGPRTLAMSTGEMESETVIAARMLEHAHPGVITLVAELTTRLAHHPDLAEVSTVGPDLTDEAAIAAAHGARHLALAVAVADTVLGDVPLARPAAIVGAAIGVAALLLAERPMPPAYAAAVLAEARANHRLPRSSVGTVPVADHRFALLETGVGPIADEASALLRAAEFDDNGLVVPVPGGAVIRTGVAEGPVRVLLRVLAEPPPDPDDAVWDEVIEVSWHAERGAASIVGPERPGDPNLLGATPPWPGDHRLQVRATGRDDAEAGGDDPSGRSELYELVVWAAPVGPPVLHRRTDRLGHRLRGEAAPVRGDRPETAYRWIGHSALGEAATVTIVTGIPWAEVLQAFGADPDRPEPAEEIRDRLVREQSIDPWLMVTEAGDAVIVVEPNGWEGTASPVLRQASATGRAASLYWNANTDTRLFFAERGRLLTSFELSGDPGDRIPDAGVRATLTGLDLADRRDITEKGLVALERFTGRGFTAGDLAHLEETAIGYRILPHLPDLRPYRTDPDERPAFPVPGVLAADTDALLRLPEPQLSDVAWWAGTEAARHAGLADDPDVTACIEARALTAPARQRARRSQLHHGTHRWLWRALHNATNPEPVAAVAGAVDAAHYAAGPHATRLVAAARQRLGLPDHPNG